MQEKPRRRWLQFSLRGLIVAMVLLGVALGLFAKWWFTPFAERQFHFNGRLANEYWQRRDLQGKPKFVRWVEYYSNGVKAAEEDAAVDADGDGHFWSPDGKPITYDEWLEYDMRDRGDGTFAK